MITLSHKGRGKNAGTMQQGHAQRGNKVTLNAPWYNIARKQKAHDREKWEPVFG
jgi:hypothetical protein